MTLRATLDFCNFKSSINDKGKNITNILFNTVERFLLFLNLFFSIAGLLGMRYRQNARLG